MDNRQKRALGLNIKRLRGKIKQEELAHALGLSRTAVVNYESGKNEPGIEELLVIANTIGASLNQLLEGVFIENNKVFESIASEPLTEYKMTKPKQIKVSAIIEDRDDTDIVIVVKNGKEYIDGSIKEMKAEIAALKTALKAIKKE